MNVGPIIRAIFVTLLVMPTGCATLAPIDSKQHAQQRWSRVRSRVKQGLAKQQYDAGLFDDTIRTVSESIALDPARPEGYLLLAQANLELGRPASAQAALDAAERAGLVSSDLIYTHGVILELRGHVEAAMTEYARARQVGPNRADYVAAEAECLVALDRPDDALALLDEYADALDDDGTIAALAGHIAAMTGDVQRATSEFRQALIAQTGASSDTTKVQSLRGAAPFEPQDRHPRANELVAEELGRTLVRMGRAEEAVVVLEPIVDSQEAGNGGARRSLAQAYLALGDSAGAVALLTPYVNANPDDTLAQLMLAKAAIAENDLATALRAVDRAGQLDPDRLELWFVRATVNWRRGKLALAAAELYDLLQNTPNDADAHCLLAEVLREQQRTDAARTHFEDALRIDADCAWAANGLKDLKRAQRPAPDRAKSKLTAAEAIAD